MNKVGSLYQVKKHYWLMFPNKETATAAAVGRTGDARTAAAPLAVAAYYSTTFNCTVSYVSPKDIFVLLEVDGKFKKVLSCNGEIGWTWCEDRLLINGCFEEVTRNGY